MGLTALFSRRERATRADFEREALPHLGSLYATAHRLTRNSRDAEDLVQEAMLRAFRFFHRFEPGTNCRAWLFKILHNTFVTRYRSSSRERELVELLRQSEDLRGEDDSSPERHALGSSLGPHVQRALDSLPEEFRTVVILCDLEDLSYREIADILDCPLGTVMSRLHRGRRFLQRELRGYAEEQGILHADQRDEGGQVIPLERRGK